MAIELADKLYTSTQVADILGVSLRTLYRYMEDNKIKSMRTASGRHRFTKDHIVEFLNAGRPGMDEMASPASYNNSPRNTGYGNAPQNQGNFGNTQPNAYPDNMQQAPNNMPNPYAGVNDFQTQNNPAQGGNRMYGQANNFGAQQQQQQAPAPVAQPYTSQPVADNDEFEFDVTDYDDAPAANTQPQNQPANSFDDNFDAPSNFSQPAQQPQQTQSFAEPQAPVQQAPAQPAYSPVQQQSSPFSAPAAAAVAAQAPPVEAQDLASSLNVRYYRSEYSDLIELAKKIKDTANSKDLEYGFTLYAGLSLHFPINPFTVLNFYANPEDMQLWKDELKLSPSPKREDANVGVIINTDIVFVPTKEIGSFKVVDDKVLLRDLSAVREEELVKQFRQHLTSI